tara:strand:- start:65 stop:4858 length:4794 start_codon:yes stop_codon:yes gene_type:complete
MYGVNVPHTGFVGPKILTPNYQYSQNTANPYPQLSAQNIPYTGNGGYPPVHSSSRSPVPSYFHGGYPAHIQTTFSPSSQGQPSTSVKGKGRRSEMPHFADSDSDEDLPIDVNTPYPLRSSHRRSTRQNGNNIYFFNTKVDKRQTVPLKEGHYYAWRSSMEALMDNQGIIGAVELSDDFKSRDRHEREAMNKTAYTFIYLSLYEEMIEIIIPVLKGRRNAAELWKWLSDYHIGQSNQDIAFARRELESLTLGDCNYNVVHYVAKVNNLLTTLRALGEHLSTQQVTDIILTNLPPILSGVKQIIRHSNEELTLHQITLKIKREIQQMVLDGEWVTPTASAKIAAKTATTTSSPATSSSSFPATSAQRVKCTYCGAPGHMKKQCNNRRSDIKKGIKLETNVREKYKAVVVKPSEPVEDPPTTGFSFVAQPTLAATDSRDPTWILDTGASHHMTFNLENLFNFRKMKEPILLHTAGHDTIEVTHEGSVLFNPIGNGATVTLTKVLYSEKFSSNLISWSTVQNSSPLAKLHGSEKKMSIYAENKSVMEFNATGSLFGLTSHAPSAATQNIADHEIDGNSENFALVSQPNDSPEDIEVWHWRLAHLNEKDIKNLSKSGFIPSRIAGQTLKKCEFCAVSKSHKLPFNKERSERYKSVLNTISSDMMGPITPTAREGGNYALLYTDARSGYTFHFLIANKSEQVAKYTVLSQIFQNMFGRYPLFFLSDNCKTYLNKDMNSLLEGQGTQPRYTAPHTPEQNGKSERINGTIMEATRCALSQSGLPHKFWGDALSAQLHVRNRVPTSSLDGMTPYEAFYGVKPDLKYLKPFGCTAYVHIPKALRKKLDSTAVKGIFLGYDEQRAAYKVLSVGDSKVLRSRHVTFNESEFLFRTLVIPKEMIELASNAKTDPDLIEDIITTAETVPSISTDSVMPAQAPESVISQMEKFATMLNARKGYSSPVNELTAGGSGSNTAEPEPELEDSPVSFENILQKSELHVPTDDYPDFEDGDNLTVDPTESLFNIPSDSGPVTPALTEELGSSPRFPRRTRTKKSYDDYVSKVATPNYAFAYAVKEAAKESELTDLPKSPQQAIRGKDGAKWMESLRKEFQSHIDNETWKVVQPSSVPKTANIISLMIVFRKKIDKSGAISKYKSRCVARGDKQIEGVDYFDTYSPQTKVQVVRMVVMASGHFMWKLFHQDVPTAFLNGTIEEDIYIRLPTIWNQVMTSEHHVPSGAIGKMKKGQYGLKQANREWFKCIDADLKEQGFEASTADPCLYRKVEGENILVLDLWVDDFFITGNNTELRNSFDRHMRTKYKCPPAEGLSYALGLEVSLENNCYFLSQKNYIKRILEKYGMEDCKPAPTPSQPGSVLSPRDADDDSEANFPYREAVGSLMYAAVCTRPDIIFAVSMASRFLSNPTRDHWNHVKRIMRYLQGTLDYRLAFPSLTGSEFHIEGFGDSSYADDKVSRRSTWGFNIFINKVLISWKSKLTGAIALSTMEAELYALCELAKEAIWIRRILQFILKGSEVKITLYTDNKACKDFVTNGRISSRSKHVEVRYYFLQDAIAQGKIALKWIGGNENNADIHTKSLALPAFSKHCNALFKNN